MKKKMSRKLTGGPCPSPCSAGQRPALSLPAGVSTVRLSSSARTAGTTWEVTRAGGPVRARPAVATTRGLRGPAPPADETPARRSDPRPPRGSRGCPFGRPGLPRGTALGPLSQLTGARTLTVTVLGRRGGRHAELPVARRLRRGGRGRIPAHRGVGTAVAAFVGLAERGPLNEPTLVTNWTQFTRRSATSSRAPTSPTPSTATS